LRADRLVLDASVVVEYLDEESPCADRIERLYSAISSRRVEAIIPVTTISEVLYVSARVYREAGVEDPNREAINFVTWLMRQPAVRLASPTLQVSMLAGELRKEMGISILDCYVIATASVMHATPLFLRMEREMEPYADLLAKYGVRFLAEYEPP